MSFFNCKLKWLGLLVVGVGILVCLTPFPSWAQGVPMAPEPSADSAGSAKTEAKSSAQFDKELEDSLLNSDFINSAFYKPVLSYPSEYIVQRAPREEWRAGMFAVFVTLVFLALTWPVNDLELILSERERRAAVAPKVLSAPLRFSDLAAEEAAGVGVVTRVVAPDDSDASGADGWDADSVPLTHQQRFVRGSAQEKAISAEPEAGADGRFVQALAPHRNPLVPWQWKRLAAKAILPSLGLSLEPGLHIAEVSRPISEAINAIIIELLDQTEGRIIVVSSFFDEAKLVHELIGGADTEPHEYIAKIRSNSKHLDKCLSRLAFTKGEGMFCEDFLRQARRLSDRKPGLSAVIFDVTARYEVGVLPHLLGIQDWCQSLRDMAAHGAFPLILLTRAEDGEVPSPRYKEAGKEVAGV
ncbi:hypothetical protein IJT17_07520 [bacterium]|nr:hypothetical protein [bacterium]